MGSVTSNPARGDFARLYELLIQNLTDFAVFIMDVNGVITTWNPGVEKNLGYTEAEFCGQQVSILFTPEDLAKGAPQQELDVAAREGRSFDIRWHVRKDGSRLFVDGVMSAIRAESGELVGFSKVMRDSTKRHLLQQELERSNRDLMQFAHVVSHDLQAPLRTVSVYAELLIRHCGMGEDPTVKNHAGFIRDGVQQMRMLILNLLEYAQISSSGGKRESVALETVFDHVLASLHAALVENHATVTRDPLPTVEGDETYFGQLLQNLIGNALKYRSRAAPRVHVSAKHALHEWVIAVRDNGIGIEAEYARQIFEPFKRLHGQELPGSGIGLAICKRIVEQRGGRIWVESKPGDGSTFYFTIPDV
jgi:PAS domain S-box-containing protein